ncbi:MAG: DUF1845 family protein [Betaproteobacteria bacterium]|nr:DUF1845 family protein [Betaproteobacteria bacterium]
MPAARAAIVGGRRVAAALRAIWHLSGNDNPYADWVLVNIGERRLVEIGSSCGNAARRGPAAPCSSAVSTSRCCSRASRNGSN